MSVANSTNISLGTTGIGIPSIPEGLVFDKVLYVSSVKGGDANDGQDPRRALASLSGTTGAFAKLEDGATSYPNGTLVVVGKGHTESFTAADSLSALSTNKRVYVVGCGVGVSRPTFTWTVNGSTVLFDTDSIVFDNMNFNLEPATGTGLAQIAVAQPITISGNGCGLRRILARAGTDANNIVTKGIVITGSDCFLEDVRIYSATAAESTTFLELTGANRLKMTDVRIAGATSATGVGVMRLLTTASTNVEIRRCFFKNFKALSTDAVTGIASSSGSVHDTDFGILSDSGLTAWSTPANFQFYRCKVSNLTGEAGGEKDVVSGA